MAAKVTSKEPVIKKQAFYRFIPIRATKPSKIDGHEKLKDFSVGEYGEVSVVDTGDRDWDLFVNSEKNTSQVGLNNVIANAIAQGVNPGTNPFAPKEFLDLTEVPDTLGELSEHLAKYADSEKKLGEIAKTLGITTEELIKKQVDGSLTAFIEGYKASLKKGDDKDESEK